jgi:hypothetical protein
MINREDTKAAKIWRRLADALRGWLLKKTATPYECYWRDRAFSAERLVHEFIRCFPGKCLICSMHRYGAREFGITEPIKPHDCLEAQGFGEPKVRSDEPPPQPKPIR